MLILTVFLLLISACSLAAQGFAPEIVWVKTNVFNSLAPVGDGTFRAIQPTGLATADFVRFNIGGTILERLAVTGYPSYLHAASDGHYELLAYYKDDAGVYYDTFVLKYNRSGLPIWTNHLGRLSGPPGLHPLPDGGAIAATSRYEPGFYEGVRLRHISPTGATLMESETSGGGVREVKLTSEGYLAAGDGGASDDYMVTSYDKAGRVKWTRYFGGSEREDLMGMAVSTDGQTIIVGGTSYSEFGPNKESPLVGRSDAWIVGLNAAGNKVWETALGAYDPATLAALGIVGNAIVAVTDSKIVTLSMGGLVQSMSPIFAIPLSNVDEIVAVSATDFLYRGGNGTARVHLPTLEIQSQPADRSALAGSSATFHIGALSPYEPARFQWFFGDQLLNGETNAKLTIPSVQTANLGTYSALVMNSTSTNRTRAAMLALTDAELTIEMHPSLKIKGHINRRYTIERTSGAGQATTTWERADTITLTNSPQIWVDTSLELPDQRLYRARLEE